MRLAILLVAVALGLPTVAGAAQVSDQAIHQLADARTMVEQQAPVVYARIKKAGPFPQLSADERGQVERALAGTKLSLDQYVALERRVRSDADAKRRLAVLEARSAQHGGGAPGTDATRNTPPGLSGAVPAPSAPSEAPLPSHQSYQDQHKEHEAQKTKPQPK